MYDYFTVEKNASLRGYNLYSSASEKEQVISEFLHNAQKLHSARGKNYLYHEIVSLPKSFQSQAEQTQVLQQLVEYYIELRAKDHLVLTALHTDKEHRHIHLMISANKIYEAKRTRLSKVEFANIQHEIEKFQNQLYPQYHTDHYSAHQNTENLHRTRKEQEINAKRGTKSQKDELYQSLFTFFEQTSSLEELQRVLNANDIEVYERGSTVGVIYKDKKYRLKTLGLDERYKALLHGSSFLNEAELTPIFDSNSTADFDLSAFIKEKMKSSDKASFIRSLYEQGIEFYENNDSVEVLYEGKRYRFQLLGLMREYIGASRMWDKENTMRDFKNFRSHQQHNERDNALENGS